jgi:lysophospholipase L1-like esterase
MKNCFCLLATMIAIQAVSAADLAVHEDGTGLTHTLTIEVPDRFRIVLEAAKNYGITQWYDLAGDPEGKRDLLRNPTDYIPAHAQGALFNQCLNPDDLIAHVASAGSLHKDVPRSLRMISQSPSKIELESNYSPVLGKANPELVFTTRYVITPDGRIDVHNQLRAKSEQEITMWRNAIITLGDPTYLVNNQDGLEAELIAQNQLRVVGANWQPNQWRGYVAGQSEWRSYDVVSNTKDTLTVKPRSEKKLPSAGKLSLSSSRTQFGWLRNDSLTQPVGYHKEVANYVSAHWDPRTPAPHASWTKANILLVPHPDNPRQGHGGRLHGWRGCKRVYYETGKFTLKAGETIKQQYRIQLGSSASAALPDLSDSTVCAQIAADYQATATTDLGKLDPNMAMVETDANGIQWYKPQSKPFRLLGFNWIDQDKVYRRLPVKPAWPIRKPVDNLAWNTAGGQIHFQTDSPRLLVRGKLRFASGMYHMPSTGQSGFDLYVGPPSQLTYSRSTRFQPQDVNFNSELFSNNSKKLRNFVVNFPLYNGVRDVEIGIVAGSKLMPPPDYPDARPVVVYGTSITQGGCAARPGLAYPNILSRRLNRPFINLGFSGNGKGEIELAKLINQVPDPALIVLDYEANVYDDVKKTINPFIDELRRQNPKVPILVISKILYTNELLSPERLKSLGLRADYQRDVVEKRRTAGDTNIHFLDGRTLLGEHAHEATVDGSHPNAYGFMMMAERIKPVVARILSGE